MEIAGIIPDAKPVQIPGMGGIVGDMLGWGLWIVLLSGVVGAAIGVAKLALSDKNRGGGSEPFKWMAGGVAAVMLSGSLITILNGIA